MWPETKEQQAESFSVDSDSDSERAGSALAGPGWAEWPEPGDEFDDEAFAAAIARGRELEAAA